MKQISCFLLFLSVALLNGCAGVSVNKLPEFQNEQFYHSDGTFNKEAAVDAYIALMEYHNYPVYDNIRENIYVTDFEAGHFAELGLGCVMFLNSYEGRYMQMDIYLLPGQMLPEHYHITTEKAQAKDEGWLVRYGLSYIVGEGPDNLPSEVKVPEFTQYTVKHCTITKPGQAVELNRVTSRHWQYAGPEGAIITEAANYHDDEGVKFTDKKLIMR